jgi:hypothetical protein
MDCFVARAPRNDGGEPCIQFSDLSKDVNPRSRGAMRPRLAVISRPRKKRAQGKPGARCTRGLVCNVRRKCAHEHTGPAEASRLSLRDGFTVSFGLSPVTGFLATVACERIHKLDASTGASGPHDFAVRISHARPSQLSRPPHLTRAFVTCATPLSSGETRKLKSVICPTAKAKYFCSVVWTGYG